MTIFEKRIALDNFCEKSKCESCELKFAHKWKSAHPEGCLRISDAPESDLDKALEIIGHKAVSANAPTIKDSGIRREFESGAVRDIQEGKGRCDLLPLDVVAVLSYGDFARIFTALGRFQACGEASYLHGVLDTFASIRFDDIYSMLLETSKHFEAGAKKYGEYNWQKGIPVHCYIDSAVRHFLKWMRGDDDEPHDLAFCWNILCAIWTCKNIPSLNDYAEKEGDPND